MCVCVCVCVFTLRQAACADSTVPPPTVPISSEGIVTDIRRSSPEGPPFSVRVIQLELPTVCAGS